MTRALTTQNTNTAIVAGGMTRDQIELLKRTIAKGTTDDEFALFLNTATRLGLDPFAKQIYAVKRWTRDGEQMAIQVGIDGFRAVAERTGELDGQEGPFWCGDDGIWVDIWLHDSNPAAAKVVVYKRGCSHPFTGVATFRSYVQTTKDGKPNRQWAQMPDVMLAKCAEALALRKAFPAKLSGVYAPEEMGQADNPTAKHADAIDAEVAEAGPTLAEQIAAADSIEALKLLAPKCNALPRGSDERNLALSAYRARQDALTKASAA